jgi:hypothetical protein
MMLPEPKPITHLAVYHTTTRGHEVFAFDLTSGKASPTIVFSDDNQASGSSELPLTLIKHVRIPKHILKPLQEASYPSSFQRALGFVSYERAGSKAVSDDYQILNRAPYSGTIIGMSYFAEKHAAHKLKVLGYKSFSTTVGASTPRKKQLALVGISFNTEIPLTVYHRRICRGVYPLGKAA